MRVYSKLIVAIAIVLCATSCAKPVQNQTAKEYKTLTVVQGNSIIDSRYSASLRAEQFVDIRPQISGVITEIAIKEGAQVKRGETLFVIDQVPYRAALDVAKANVASATSALGTAKLNAESGKELFDEGVISNNEYQTLRNTQANAEASLALAKAQETSAANDLSYTVVKSPLNGVAGMINYRVGALVSSSITDPLLTVSNNSQIYAYFSISESALISLIQQYGSSDSLMSNMNDVTLQLNNGTTYEHTGRVDAISGVIDQSTGTVSVRAIFDNPELLLRDGGNGTLVIPTNYENEIVIPQIATYEIQNKIFVYKVIDGKAVSYQIEVLPINNGREYVVKNGLQLGDVIIAEGAGLVREGTVISGN